MGSNEISDASLKIIDNKDFDLLFVGNYKNYTKKTTV